MIKLIFKSLKSFIAEEKILAILLISSLCIGNFVYFYTTEGLLQDKDKLSNHITINITGLEKLDAIKEIVMTSAKDLKYLDLATETSVMGRGSAALSANYFVSCSLLDPKLEAVEFISEKKVSVEDNKYMILSNVGQNIFSYMEPGEIIYVSGIPVKCIGSGWINFPYLIIGAMNVEGFFDLFSQDEDREFKVYIYYEVDKNKKEIVKVENKLKEIGLSPETTLYEPPSAMDVLASYKDSAVLISLVISVLICGHYVNARLRDYSIFRIMGINSNKLTLLYLAELFVIFTLSFWIISLLWFIHLKIIGSGTYNLNLICIYGYVLLTVVYGVLNLPYLHILSGKSVMSLFRKSRRIG